MGTAIVVIVVVAVIALVFYVALRHQREREEAGGADPHADPPEPAPERRQPPGSQ
jgi:heme/copper-type cytochrome/quinol oxidase subunit 2